GSSGEVLDDTALSPSVLKQGRAVSGEELFNRIYVDRRVPQERFVARRVAHTQVEDIVAETVLVAWRRLDPVPENSCRWLFGVARNILLRSIRSSGRWSALRVRMASQPPEPVSDLADDVAARVDLVSAWSRLSDGEREVLALVAWDGLTPGEAAAVLGCR